MDGTIDIHSKIENLVNSLKHSYLTVIEDIKVSGQLYPQTNYFQDEHELIHKLKRDVLKINKTLEIHYK